MPKDYVFNKFYRNCFLIDNHILFAVYRDLLNKECLGKKRSDPCVCSLGESYLYCFDLETRELHLVNKYPKGTFLIDYDLNNVEYYYDGELYINNIAYRQCEIITPGESEKIRMDYSFSSMDEKGHYYLSYYKGEFYGI